MQQTTKYKFRAECPVDSARPAPASSAAHPEERHLVPLEIAIRPYVGVSRRMVRAWIASGRLAAVKVGRAWLVEPGALQALLQPKLQPPRPRRVRESESQRIDRQLRAAGIDVSKS